MNEHTCAKCGQYGLNCKCYYVPPPKKVAPTEMAQHRSITAQQKAGKAGRN